jgi:hypothetical protein
MKITNVVCGIATATGYKNEVVVIKSAASAACLSKEC